MLFASLRLLTSLPLSQPCFGAIMGVLGPSFLHPPPKITQLYPTFFCRVVARYKRGSGCGALRSVFILAMPPFTTLKISPSFGFWLTDSLSENCTGLAALPSLPSCNLKPHSEKSKFDHRSNSPPSWPFWPLCKVSYRRV